MILREQTLVMPLGVHGSDRKKLKSWFISPIEGTYNLLI